MGRCVSVGGWSCSQIERRIIVCQHKFGFVFDNSSSGVFESIEFFGRCWPSGVINFCHFVREFNAKAVAKAAAAAVDEEDSGGDSGSEEVVAPYREEA